MLDKPKYHMSVAREREGIFIVRNIDNGNTYKFVLLSSGMGFEVFGHTANVPEDMSLGFEDEAMLEEAAEILWFIFNGEDVGCTIQ